MTDTHRDLFSRLVDGGATEEDRVRARRAVAELEAEDLILARAVRESAGEVDVADDVCLELGQEILPLSEALEAEAGTLDVADTVQANTFGSASLGPILRDAMTREAGGGADLWNGVARELFEPDQVFSTIDGMGVALRQEAFTEPIDVVDGVLSEVRRHAVGAGVPRRVPANTATRRWYAPALMVAVALVTAWVVAQRSGHLSGIGAGDGAVAEIDDGAPTSVRDMRFAAAGEIVVQELNYGETTEVHVFQSDGENAPLIIWVEEEATL